MGSVLDCLLAGIGLALLVGVVLLFVPDRRPPAPAAPTDEADCRAL